ncbi:MAG: polysaccharide biosynthesis C-terminal domain-containing protein, partial [Spirochaetaceae bacterium]|nr:polysaccharide biosynthesis C-terminal domain-containing protein [Spirochaetaceae bacterium]
IAEKTIQEALSYLRIQVYGFPSLSFTFTINAVLRGVGNTRAAFYNNAVSNLVNIFFNYCLIGGRLGFPALGVARGFHSYGYRPVRGSGHGLLEGPRRQGICTH